MGEERIGQSAVELHNAELEELRKALRLAKDEVEGKIADVSAISGYNLNEATVIGSYFAQVRKRLLFLDDRSKRLHAALRKYGQEYDVTLVCTAKECIKMLSNDGPWDVVSLDHDLCFEEFVNSDREDCGMEVVRWIEKNHNYWVAGDLYPSKIIIHTSNNSARAEMVRRLRSIGLFPVVSERFSYDD